MKTDRELLELAAKAAGGVALIEGSGWITVREDGPNGAWWNPLADDGDALRLAVKLRLSISTPHEGFRSYAQSQDLERGVGANCGVHGLDESDPFAATRRAIVRAAAEIGRATKEAK